MGNTIIERQDDWHCDGTHSLLLFGRTTSVILLRAQRTYEFILILVCLLTFSERKKIIDCFMTNASDIPSVCDDRVSFFLFFFSFLFFFFFVFVFMFCLFVKSE